MEFRIHSLMERECVRGKGADVMIQTILAMIAGLAMVGAVIVLGLSAVAVFTGITTHNLLSMLAMAGVLAAIATCLQWLLRQFSSGSRENQTNPGMNSHRAVPDRKQNIQFDPWTDEWYGSGPWWKKW